MLLNTFLQRNRKIEVRIVTRFGDVSAIPFDMALFRLEKNVYVCKLSTSSRIIAIEAEVDNVKRIVKDFDCFVAVWGTTNYGKQEMSYFFQLNILQIEYVYR